MASLEEAAPTRKRPRADVDAAEAGDQRDKSDTLAVVSETGAARLCIGPDWQAENGAWLAAQGVAAVLYLSDEPLADDFRVPALTYQDVSLADDVDADLDAILPSSLAFLRMARRWKPRTVGLPVLAHMRLSLSSAEGLLQTRTSLLARRCSWRRPAAVAGDPRWPRPTW